MAQLPEVVATALQNIEGAAVFTTVSENGIPNAVYVMPFKTIDGNKVIIVDNYFGKTRTNILNATQGSLLFITKDMSAYQIKGTLEYQTSGDIYEEMRQAVDPKHPRVAIVILNVEEVYSGTQKLV